jgi:hypothetical protein
MIINRRGLITGLLSLVAAPAIVRATSLMPVWAMDDETFEEICARLSARVDDFHMRDSNISCSIVGKPIGESTPYFRFSEYETLGEIIPKHDRKELGPFTMTFPAPRRNGLSG